MNEEKTSDKSRYARHYYILWTRHVEEKVILTTELDFKCEMMSIKNYLIGTIRLVHQGTNKIWELRHRQVYAMGCRVAKMKEEGKDFQELPSFGEYIKWDNAKREEIRSLKNE